MNVWTGVFQSVHSALIDELTERHPEPKPELGMPIREATYRIPDPGLTSILVSQVSVSEQDGVLLLASEPGFIKALKVPATGLWAAIMKRAAVEFERRRLAPKVAEPVTLMGSSPLPSGFPTLGRVVWIPFRIPAGRCHLGLGV